MEDQMTQRLKRSVLLSLINSARGKFPNVKEKIQQWQIEQELGRLFEKTKTGLRREKEILRFAEANKLMIVIPE